MFSSWVVCVCVYLLYILSTGSLYWGLPWWLIGKEFTCNVGDLGLIPGLGRSPKGGHSNPLQYSCLENPPKQRCLAGCSPWGCKESDMIKQQSIAHHSIYWVVLLSEWSLSASLIDCLHLTGCRSVEAKSESLSLVTLCDPINCRPPGSSVHGNLQARILEWVTVSFSRGSSLPRDQICVSCLAGRFLLSETPGKPWSISFCNDSICVWPCMLFVAWLWRGLSVPWCASCMISVWYVWPCFFVCFLICVFACMSLYSELEFTPNMWFLWVTGCFMFVLRLYKCLCVVIWIILCVPSHIFFVNLFL